MVPAITTARSFAASRIAVPIMLYKKANFAVSSLDSLPRAVTKRKPAYTMKKMAMGRPILTTISKMVAIKVGRSLIVSPNGLEILELICPACAEVLRGKTTIHITTNFNNLINFSDCLLINSPKFFMGLYCFIFLKRLKEIVKVSLRVRNGFLNGETSGANTFN